jgi:predicted amidophosphoribosyltransferase
MEPVDLLVCPSCAREHPPSERFCGSCGMPLVHPGATEQPASERQRRARKIKPEYAEGPLVKVAHTKTQYQAEFIAGLLLEEGIPCVLSATMAGYTPTLDPRDVLVPESGAQAAREALKWERPGGERREEA